MNTEIITNPYKQPTVVTLVDRKWIQTMETGNWNRIWADLKRGGCAYLDNPNHEPADSF